MKTLMLKLARLFALIFAIAAPTAARAEPPVWVIRDADSTITLFGSVHILPKVEWRPAAVTTALKEADDVWFEIPLDAAAQLSLQQSVVSRGLLPPGQSLRDQLKPEDRERLQRVARSLGVQPAALDVMRPWMADLALSQAFAAKSGASASQGVEQVLYAQVPKEAKLRSFETGPQQIAMLADMPAKDQLAGLAETLRQIEEEPNSFIDLVGYWTGGNMAAIIKEALEPVREASPVYYDVLITRRNRDWVGQIKQRLAGSGDTLIVVGVGHLVGPDGVPELLRKEGIKVEGP